LRLTSETRNYFLRVRSFTLNARLFLVANALQGLGVGIWGVIFYLYLNLGEVGFAPDFIGNMFSVGAIATGLVALPAGLLCERIGTKRTILISLAANLFNIVQIVVLEPSILLLASLISGLIATLGWVASAPFMMEDTKPQERTFLFSLNFAIWMITGVIGSLLGGIMPDMFNSVLGLATGAIAGSAVGYRITLALASVASAAAVVPILLVRANHTIPRQEVGALLSFRNMKSWSTIIKFIVPVAIVGLGAGFIIPLFNVFFKLRYSATSETVGTIFALGNVTVGIASLGIPVLSERLGKLRSIVACQFLSMPFIMLVTISPNLALSTGAYLARGTLMQMAIPLENAFQMEMVTENERATTSGLMTMADNIPRAVSSSISGGMMSGSDFYTPFLFTTLTYFASSSLLYVFFRKAERFEAKPKQS
jgi:MFS family permease